MRPRAIGMISACLAAAACGYWLALFLVQGNPGETAVEKSLDRAGSDRSESDSNARGPRKEKPPALEEKKRDARQLEALRKDLMMSFANSPSPAHDWALRARSAALLATLCAADLEKFWSELRPAQNEMLSSDDWRWALSEQIYQAWGLKDPAAACRNGGAGAFDDWLKRDPEAATRFFEQIRQSGGMESLAKSLQRLLLNQQALTDLPGAAQALSDLDSKSKQSTLATWTRMFANDPAKRQELVDLLVSWPDAEVSEASLKSLIREFSERSPSEAAAFVETLAVSESVKDQLSHEVIGEWALKDPKQAFGAWIERGESEVPAPLIRAMDDWSTNFPGVTESIEWVNGLQPGPVREQFKTHMVGYLAELERFPESAQLSAGIADPTERVRQMKLVKRIWEERYPKNANAWFSKLPPEDQAALGKPLE